MMNDNIISIMKIFVLLEWMVLKDGVLFKMLLIKEGVGWMFGFLLSRLKEEIIRYVLEDVKIREGFWEFVVFVKEYEFLFYIVSGGMDFFVYFLFEGIVEKDYIYCNYVLFDSDYIYIDWFYFCKGICRN